MFQDQSSSTHLDARAAGSAPFCSVAEAVREVREGRMVVVCDDEGRDAQGGIAIAAEFATAEAVNFMATHARGLIGLAMTPERCLELALPPMTNRDAADRDEAPRGTAFTVSIEAREGVTTGISAADRAHTIRVATDPRTGPADIVRPGHVFPLRARPGGVFERRGQTEGAVDLARLAGLTPAGVTCRILDDEGEAAQLPHLRRLCAEHGLKMISIDALVEFRENVERRVERVTGSELPAQLGDFRIAAYRSPGGHEHVALVHGDVDGARDVLVHAHRADLVGDVLAATGGTGPTADAMRRIQAEGRGVLVFVSGRDRLDHLVRRLTGTTCADTAPATPDHALAGRILLDLGVVSARLLDGDRLAVEELRDQGLPASPVEATGAPSAPVAVPTRVAPTA